MKWMSHTHVRLCCLLLFMAVGGAALPASALATMPPNDDFANADDLGHGLTASASGSNLWATVEVGEPGRVFAPAIASVWYRWTAPQSGVVRVQTCDSNFDTTLAIFRGSALGALARVAANDDRCGAQSGLRFFAIAGTTYSIAVDGWSHQGSIELLLRFLVPPSNDDFGNALDLGNSSTASASGSNSDATVEPREPDHHGSRTIASVWYRWTAPASRKIRIETCGSDFDTVIAVYVGRGFDALFSVASNDDHDRCGDESDGSFLRFNSVAGTTYHIAVAGYRRDQGSIEFKLAKVKPNKRRGEAEPVRRRESASSRVLSK
jgi:hypothetical protein